MKVTATLTLGVYFSALFREMFFRFSTWAMAAGGYLFSTLVNLTDPKLRENPFLFAAMVIVMGTFLALVVLFTFLLYVPYYSARRYLKLPGNREPHQFELRETGFYHCTAMREDLTTWQAVDGASRTRGYIIVKIASWLFHVIPRNAFSDEASYNAFFEEIQARISSASKS
jgi:hypothetical protein